MIYFNADPRDAYRSGGNVCGTCCCQDIRIAPAEVNKVQINYAPWAAPLGGHGLQNSTEFAIEQKSNPTPQNAPTNIDYRFASTAGVAIVGDVSVSANAPIGETITFGLVPFSGPEYGEITFDPNGSFTYEPTAGRVGYDHFFFWTEAGGVRTVNQAQLKVSQTAPADPLPDHPLIPDVSVAMKTVNVDQSGYLLSFQLKASPAAEVGAIYRMTIRQPALDCDCNEYFHVSCYDITIAKC